MSQSNFPILCTHMQLCKTKCILIFKVLNVTDKLGCLLTYLIVVGLTTALHVRDDM